MIKKFVYKIKNASGLYLVNRKPDVQWTTEAESYTFTTFESVCTYLKDKATMATFEFLTDRTFKDCEIVSIEITEKKLFNLKDWY